MATDSASPVPSYPPPPRGEAHWPPELTVAVAIGLQLLLPDRLTIVSHWLLPGIEALMLVLLVVASPQRLEGEHALRRRIALTVTAVSSIANGISVVLLTRLLLHRSVANGHQLVIAGGVIWLTNVLVFALWYWELDRSGPGRRAAGHDGPPDFLFPQMSDAVMAAEWRPRYPDYLYISLTNATALSPTDTMPLSIAAKMVMSLQALISLVTMALVVARAVNIL
jgi:uncharacterized membrane protein